MSQEMIACKLVDAAFIARKEAIRSDACWRTCRKSKS